MKKVTDLKENEVIHCKTKDEAEKIITLIVDNGFCGFNDVNQWLGYYKYYKKDTCYNPTNQEYCDYNYYKSNHYTIYPASDFISPIYTIEDLRKGRCAVVNDGTLDELNRVLLTAFPNELPTAGSFEYYYGNGDSWYYHDEPCPIPTQSVEEFLKQLNNETMKSKTLNREQFKQIYDIACSDWKIKLMDQFKELMVKDTVKVSDNYYKLMRKACAKEQHLLFDKIFGKDDNVVYLKYLKDCGEAIIVTNKDSEYYNHIIVYVSNKYAIDLTNNSHWSDSKDVIFNDVYGKRIKLVLAYKLLED